MPLSLALFLARDSIPRRGRKDIRASATGYPEAGEERCSVSLTRSGPDSQHEHQPTSEYGFQTRRTANNPRKGPRKGSRTEDNPDVIALRDIVNDKIERLEEESSKVNEAC